jgi:predicted transglutaminase-like cysteine proteinase
MTIFRTRAAFLGVMLFLSMALCACAGGRISETGPAMALGAPAAPPAAFLDYCSRLPAECGVDPARADAVQTVSRRYWKAVFAANDPHLKGGRIDWAGVAQSIDEAPAAIRAADAGEPRAPEVMTPDQFLNRHGDPELIRAATRAASGPARAGASPLSDPEPERLIWDAETRRRVEAVNHAVNAAISERPDIVTYGVEDYWAIPTLVGADHFGDCEDYALMKRRDLIAAGVASETLSIAIVKTQNNSMHAVLLIATDRGDFVLDNLDPAIRAWTETNYRWIERQAPGSAFAWVRPGGAASPHATGTSRIAMMRARPGPMAPAWTAMQWGRVPGQWTATIARGGAPIRTAQP